MMVASMAMVVWNLQESTIKNANTGSRYATVESLVDRGTYFIDKSTFRNTVDRYKVGRHYISSKPPTLPTYAAGVYWVYQKLTGKKIARHEGDVVRFVSLMSGGLAHLLFLIFFYRLSLLLLSRQLAILLALAAACFAYLGVGYATHLNNHSIGAALLVVGLFYAFRIRLRQGARLRHWITCGLVMGVLPALDLPSAIFTVAVGCYLAAHDFRRACLVYLPALLPGVLSQLVLTYHISGSILPFQKNPALKTFKDFYFRNPGGIDALREPKHIYAFNVLVGHHGVFSMTPLYAFGLWELIARLRRRSLVRESALCAVALLVQFYFYISSTSNYGGWCVGMRWLVPAQSVLLILFALWLDRARLTRAVWPLVIAAFAVSSFHVQDALDSPFQFSVWHNWLEGKPNRNRVGKRFNLPRKKRKRKRRRSPRSKRPAARAQKPAGAQPAAHASGGAPASTPGERRPRAPTASPSRDEGGAKPAAPAPTAPPPRGEPPPAEGAAGR